MTIMHDAVDRNKLMGSVGRTKRRASRQTDGRRTTSPEGSDSGRGQAEVSRGARGAFFFSSRRRHTSYIGDWSSDVCSSDLERTAIHGFANPHLDRGNEFLGNCAAKNLEIGRASCRERVESAAAGVSRKKNSTGP